MRPARAEDADAIWRVLEPALRAGETYALPRHIARDEALARWATGPERWAFVAETEDRIVGAYYLRANDKAGPGVANCGYMVAPEAAGRGVASAMCAHSLVEARRLGFFAMQFNFVIESNIRAVSLWRRFGFEVVERLPRAFDHPKLGPVDALIMRREL